MDVPLSVTVERSAGRDRKAQMHVRVLNGREPESQASAHSSMRKATMTTVQKPD